MGHAAAGAALSAAEAARLETELASNPEDSATRARLLGYWFLRGGDEEAKAQHQVHALWFVENWPRLELTASAFASFNPNWSASSTQEMSAAWQRQLDARPDDGLVLGNAAAFFSHTDAARAEELYREAVRLHPSVPDWLEGLARQLARKMGDATSTIDRGLAVQALDLFERARALTTRQSKRFYQLNTLARTALKAGNLEAAARYAQETLAQAKDFPKDWNYGNAIYTGHEVLGLVDLGAGRIAEAKERLLAASKTPGSPQLNSFGPSFELAGLLATKGELPVVREFLESVMSFWEMGQGPLRKWISDIDSGRAPDFEKKMEHLVAERTRDLPS